VTEGEVLLGTSVAELCAIATRLELVAEDAPYCARHRGKFSLIGGEDPWHPRALQSSRTSST